MAHPLLGPRVSQVGPAFAGIVFAGFRCLGFHWVFFSFEFWFSRFSLRFLLGLLLDLKSGVADKKNTFGLVDTGIVDLDS